MKPIPYRDVKRKLEPAGLASPPQKGSHVKFAKTIAEGRLTVIVPYHPEVSPGTIRSILRQFGLSQEEFEELLITPNPNPTQAKPRRTFTVTKWSHSCDNGATAVTTPFKAHPIWQSVTKTVVSIDPSRLKTRPPSVNSSCKHYVKRELIALID